MLLRGTWNWVILIPCTNTLRHDILLQKLSEVLVSKEGPVKPENTKLNNENNKLRNELQMLEIEQMKLLEDAQKDAVTIKNYQNQERHSFLN